MAGYTGLTQKIQKEIDENRISSWMKDASMEELFAYENEAQRLLFAMLKELKVFPDTVVKINGVAMLLGMFENETCAGITPAMVTNEALNDSLSDKTLAMVGQMADILAQNYQKYGLEDEECRSEKIMKDMITHLSLSENKAFLCRLALGTNLSYEELLNMNSHMNSCERINPYKKEDFLLKLAVKHQHVDRYNAYQSLLEDFDDITQMRDRDARKEYVEAVDDMGSMILGETEVLLDKVYSQPGEKGKRKMEPVIAQLISQYKSTLKARIERSIVWEGKTLVEEVSKKIMSSSANIAKIAKDLRENHDCLQAKLRFFFEKGTNVTIPKGTKLVIDFGMFPLAFTVVEEAIPTENQVKWGFMDVDAYAYGLSNFNGTEMIKKGEMKLLSPLPKGIQRITNNKEIKFSNVELLVKYDPYKFVGRCEPVHLLGTAGSSKKPSIKIVTEGINVPYDFTCLVPVQGNPATIEVAKDYQGVENQTNKWKCRKILAESISVAKAIQGEGIKKGELLVKTSLITSIPEGTMFVYEKQEEGNTGKQGKKKKNVVSEYSYCSTEEVKEGIVTIHAEIQSDSIKDFKLAKQTLFVDKEDQERVQNSGILSFETLKRYDVPKTILFCFNNIMFGRYIQKDAEPLDIRLSDIGEWLFEAELTPDIENAKKLTRNDIITLVFFLCGLEPTNQPENQYDVFEKMVNYHLKNCGFHDFYPVAPYERMIAYILKHNEGEAILDAYRNVWEAAYAQRRLSK